MSNSEQKSVKKSWWKRWWFITLVVVVLVLVVLYVIGSNAEPKGDSSIPEATRMEIYKEISAATEKASKEAYELYPVAPNDPRYSESNLNKAVEMDNKLVEKYVGEVRTRYGISEEVEIAITGEGVEKRWPMK